MNKMIYNRPLIVVNEVVAERGYGDSIILPGFGTEEDELTY